MTLLVVEREPLNEYQRFSAHDSLGCPRFKVVADPVSVPLGASGVLSSSLVLKEGFWMVWLYAGF